MINEDDTQVAPGASRLTMQADLTLRLPREDEEDEFLRAHRATSPGTPSFLHYYTEGMPFRRYLELLAEQESGLNLPPNHVPSTFLFAFVEKRITGRASIRHSLNPFLEQLGGHIGYVVVPEFRRCGYGPVAGAWIAQFAIGVPPDVDADPFVTIVLTSLTIAREPRCYETRLRELGAVR